MSARIGAIGVVGAAPPPLPLLKALVIIDGALHKALEAVTPGIVAGSTRGACVLAVPTAVEFLALAGIAARVRSVFCYIEAHRGTELLHTVGIGHPASPLVLKDKWNGHLVVEAAGRWLIDPTLSQAARPAWPDLPCMLAIEIPVPNVLAPPADFDRMKFIAGCAFTGAGYRCQVSYFDRPENQDWQERRAYREAQRRRARAARLMWDLLDREQQRAMADPLLS